MPTCAYSGLLRRLYDSPGADGFTHITEALPIKEGVGFKKRMLVMKYIRDREDCDYTWFVWDLALKIIIMKYLCSNKPTE